VIGVGVEPDSFSSFITGIEFIISGGAELAYGGKLRKAGAVQL
jgi:hypothetical protein